MSGSSGFTTGGQVKVYYDAGFTNASPTYADITHASNGLVIAGNELKEVRDIGDIEQSANNIEFGVYGEDVQKKVAGQASLGDFTFTYALQQDLANHKALAASTIGDAIAIGIQTVTDEAVPSVQNTIDYILGTVGGVTKATQLDDVAQVTITVAMSQKPLRIDQA